jgi:esterase/lipase superfamily enzyme
VPSDPEIALPIGELNRTVTFLGIKFSLPPSKTRDVWLYPPKTYTSSNDFFAAVEDNISKHSSKNLLLGVHGFNDTFEFATRRLAKFAYDTSYEGTTLLYSWPAGDGIEDYGHDSEVVSDPRQTDQFTDFLEALLIHAHNAGATNVQVIAHSMGNRLLNQAVHMLINRHHEGVLFDAVIMAAPDLPANSFAADVWPKLQRVARRCTLYVCAYDKALFGSKIINNDGPRVGQWSDAGIPIVLSGLETVDAAHVASAFLDFDHDAFVRDSGARDVGVILNEGLDATSRVTRGTLCPPNQGQSWFELAPRTGPCPP